MGTNVMYAAHNTSPINSHRPGVIGLGYLGGNRFSRRPFRASHFLGALDPNSVADSIFPESGISSTPGFTQAVWDDIEQSAATGQIAGFTQPCSGISSSSNSVLAAKAGGLTLSTGGSIIAATSPALAAGPVGLAIMAGSALVGLFASIFTHHAQAVAREQQVECVAVPAFNNAAAAISAAVQNGTITPQQGIAAIAQALAEFQQTVSPIMKNDANDCNAVCVWLKCAQAATASLQSQFQDIQNSGSPSDGTESQSAGASVFPVATLAPIPSSSYAPLLLIAAIVIGAAFL